MKEKFTSGEWVNDAEDFRSSIGVKGFGEVVSVFISPETKEQDVANAHLITAAPKMYREIEGDIDRLNSDIKDLNEKMLRLDCFGDEFAQTEYEIETIKCHVKSKTELLAESRGEKS
jgi:peptidoglycan hydrolase CwlO-like protein